VLGVWAASCADAEAAAAAAAAAVNSHHAVYNPHDSSTPFLALYGSRYFVPTLQWRGWGSTAKQQLWAPECSMQHTRLPPGTTDTQVGWQHDTF
jgi:hypothetical protein